MSLRLISTLHALKLEKERGATAVEYGLMVALIAVAIMAAVTTLGGNMSSRFSEVASEVAKQR